MIRKLFIVLFISNLCAPINPSILTTMPRNMECIQAHINSNESLKDIGCGLQKVLNILQTHSISEDSYQAIRNILTGSDPQNISTNSLIGKINLNTNTKEYVDSDIGSEFIEDICAFMLFVDDIFSDYAASFYYDLHINRFTGDDRHAVRETLKIIREEVNQRFELNIQKPDHKVLLRGLSYFEKYFFEIAFKEMYFNLSSPKILIKQSEVLAKLYQNEECMKQVNKLALYKESMVNLSAQVLFFNYIVNIYLLTECMNKLWPDISNEFYSFDNFSFYINVLLNAHKMFNLVQAVFSRECLPQILMRIIRILVLSKILETNHSIEPDLGIKILDFPKFCFLGLMRCYSCITTIFLSSLCMAMQYWDMMPEYQIMKFVLLYGYYVSLQDQMKYIMK